MTSYKHFRNQGGEVSLFYPRVFGFHRLSANHIIFYNMEDIMMVNSNTTKKWDRYIEIYYFYLQCWVDKGQLFIDTIKSSLIHSEMYTNDIGGIIHGRHTIRIMVEYTFPFIHQ